MNADPHADVFFADSTLHLRGRGNRVARPREGDEECVALRVDLIPAMLRDDRPYELAMFREDACVLVVELLQQPRRAFDIGEEEGDGTARKLGHRPMMRRC